MLSAPTLEDVEDLVIQTKPEWFSLQDNKDVYIACCSMVAEKRLPDPVTVTSRSGIETFSLLGEFITSAFLGNYVEMMKSTYIRRIAITGFEKAKRDVQEEKISAYEIPDRVNHLFNAISGASEEEENDMSEAVKVSVDQVAEATLGKLQSVSYQVPFMDTACTIYRKQIHAIGGMQGTGKTAFALTSTSAQIDAEMKIVYFCTESSKHEIIKRIMAVKSGIPISNMMGGIKNKNMMPAFNNAAINLHNHANHFAIYGLGDFDLTAEGIGKITRMLRKKWGVIDMVYVDFLQDLRLPASLRSRSKEEDVAHFVNTIKDVAVNNDCAITIMSQFNRDTHNQVKPNKRSFRGSGVIDDKSHLMSVLFREGEDSDRQGEKEYETWWYSVKTRLVPQWSRRIYYAAESGEYKGMSRQ